MNPCADVDRAREGEWNAANVIDIDSMFFVVDDAQRAPANYLTKAEFLSKQEAGDFVSLHAKTIEREIQRGKLKAYKLAGKVRIRREDLEAWIAAGQIRPETSPHAI